MASNRSHYFFRSKKAKQTLNQERSTDSGEHNCVQPKISVYFDKAAVQPPLAERVARVKTSERTISLLKCFTFNASPCSSVPAPTSPKCKRRRCDEDEKLASSPVNRKSTPLEQQVRMLKEKYPRLLLMVECGYRYRFFGDDATKAAAVLDIKVRDDDEGTFVTASVPTFNGANAYVRKLTAAGYKVGIVSQLQTAAERKICGSANPNNDSGKKLFARDLTAVYTAATLIGDDIRLDGIEKEETPVGSKMAIVALVQSRNKKVSDLTLVSLQPLSGQLYYDTFCAEELLQYLNHTQPVEILIPKEESNQPFSQTVHNVVHQFVAERAHMSRMPVRLEQLDSELYLTDKLINRLRDGGEKESSEMLRQKWPHFTSEQQSCFAAVFNYMSEFGLDKSLLLAPVLQKLQRKDKMFLPLLTVRNMDLFECSYSGSVKGSLFHSLNRTATRFGARLFREWLSAPLMDVDRINQRLDVASHFASLTHCDFMKHRDILHNIPDLQGLIMASLNGKIRPSELVRLLDSLSSIVSKVTALIRTSQQDRPEALTKIFDFVLMCQEKLSDITSFINLEAARSNDYEAVFSDWTQFPDVLLKREQVALNLDRLERYKETICKTLGFVNFDYTSVAGTDYLVEVKDGVTVPDSWMKVNATKKVARYRTPEVNSILPNLLFARECLLESCRRSWALFLSTRTPIFRSLSALIHSLARLDCLISLGDIARQHGFVRPKLSRNRDFVVQDGRNMIVENALAVGTQYVANDITFLHQDRRALLLTGPNMGGKSCYLRQVAQIALMAQIGSFVPAEAAQVPLFDAIFLRVGARDLPWAGKSTLAVELDEAGLILNRASSESLVLMDELGRGTGTHDGAAIAAAVLKHLVETVLCTTIFVTHYTQLTLFTHLVRNGHMSYMNVDNDDGVLMLYKLTQGPTHSSFGLNVARMAGLDESITRLAAKVAEMFEQRQRCFTS